MMLTGKTYRYVAFERGRNAPGSGKVDMAALVAAWAGRLQERAQPLSCVAYFGHSGNYLLDSTEDLSVSEVSRILRDTLGTIAAVFRAEDFAEWLGTLHKTLAAPALAPLGRRPTRGVVMDVQPEGGLPPKPSSSEKLIFGDFARPRIRDAWKMDILRADGKGLDPRKREGGWGIVAEAMNRARQGDWTARSLRTLDGLADKLGQRETPSADREDQPESTAAVTRVERDPRALLRQLLAETALQTAAVPLLGASTALDTAIHARRLVESAIRMLGARHALPLGRQTLFEVMGALTERGVLSPRVNVYFHAIRRLGNEAVHTGENARLTEDDGEVIAWMILLALREVLEARAPDGN